MSWLLRLGLWMNGVRRDEADRIVLWKRTGRIEPYDSQIEAMLAGWRRVKTEERASKTRAALEQLAELDAEELWPVDAGRDER